MMNLKTFFAYIRNAPCGGKLTQQQVEGCEAIIKEYDLSPETNDPRHLAYILAIVFHETGGRMQPVREGFANSDAQARRIVAKYKYGKPDGKHVYYGRGHVQLTWRENYKRMGEALGLPLEDDPDLALDKNISARILIVGMIKGMFTGKSLNDYFNGNTNDPVGARRIINGTDKNKLIAGYHENFLDAIKHAMKEETPADVTEEKATPDKPNLVKDKTTIGGVTMASAGAASSGLLSVVDNPWALGAVAILAVIAAIGAYLFFTARIVTGKLN